MLVYKSLIQNIQPVPRVTKALITRAFLEMDLHLGRVTKALGNFLEDELSPSYLGLSSGARIHLDHFRSFLHSYHVEKYGYWPPLEGSGFPKDLYKSMYFSFRSLYDYLADLDSTDSFSDQKPASGGICVLQNVQTFDKRYKFQPLPHPLPLVPTVAPSRAKTQSQRGLMPFKLGTKQARTEEYLTTRAALAAATNSKNIQAMACPLVKAYLHFERTKCCKLEEKVSISDARKVRWLLIYGILQTLVSAIRAPVEVRDTEDLNYPLCCQTAGTPPWRMAPESSLTPNNQSVLTLDKVESPGLTISNLNAPPAFPNLDKSLPNTPGERISIHPDCEAIDYFSFKGQCSTENTPVKRIDSCATVEMPAPLRVGQTASVLRNTSMRSIKALALSPFGSRRSSVDTKRLNQPFCEILVHGYGNGLNTAILNRPTTPHEIHELPSHHTLKEDELTTDALAAPLGPQMSDPIISEHLYNPPANTDHPETPDLSTSSECHSSPMSPMWSSAAEDSSESSAPSSNCDSSESIYRHRRRSSSVYSCNSQGTPLAVQDTKLTPDQAVPPTAAEAIEAGEFDFQFSNEKILAEEKDGILVKRSFSVESFQLTKAEMDIYNALNMSSAGGAVGGSRMSRIVYPLSKPDLVHPALRSLSQDELTMRHPSVVSIHTTHSTDDFPAAPATKIEKERTTLSTKASIPAASTKANRRSLYMASFSFGRRKAISSKEKDTKSVSTVAPSIPYESLDTSAPEPEQIGDMEVIKAIRKAPLRFRGQDYIKAS
jgi:hypothetical protein